MAGLIFPLKKRVLIVTFRIKVRERRIKTYSGIKYNIIFIIIIIIIIMVIIIIISIIIIIISIIIIII